MAIMRKTTRLALIAASLAGPSVAGAIDLDGTWAMKLKCTQVGPGFPIERTKVDLELAIGQDGDFLDVELNGNRFAFGRVITDSATPTKAMLSVTGCGPDVVTPSLLSMTAEAKAGDDGKGSLKGSLTIAQRNLVSLCTAEAKRIGPGTLTKTSCGPDRS